MKRKVVSLCSVAMAILCLTGCGSSSDIARLNNLQALNSESTVNSYSLTTSEKEEAVYAQVVARQLLDLTTLDACSDNEKQQVLQFMNNVDSQLCGSLSSDDGVISEEYTNYLLMEFQKTPYYWQRTKTTIRGIDAESRSIVVDVDYKTINFKKDVQNSSYLVQGEPNYEQKMQVRFSRWISILDAKYKNHNVSWQSLYNEFVSVYGNPADIFKSQRNINLTDSIFETGNQLTYTGLIDSSEEDSHATMTVRYILTPSYKLGINTGMVCSHMYKTSYMLNNDCTEGMELFKDDGYATIADNVYKLLYSYFTCIDESDYSGLYKLTKNFGDLDKYYSDYFDTTYRKHEGFTVSLFDISGTKVKCGVSISSKVRAKGSNMTYPIYTDRYFVQLELINDSLQVTNLVLLSSTLEGEPSISTKSAETTGFVSSIDLDNQDKKDIEVLISEFGALQLLDDTSSDDFGNIVDISMGQSQLSELKKNMTSIGGAKKVVWIVNYMQGTSNYASLKCRELYQNEDNSIHEADVTYNFINKGNSWYIYSYDINSSVKLDTTNLTTTGSLCICTPGKVDVLTSQVINTTGSQGGNSLENIGTSYDHDVYTPILKNGTTQQGLVLLSPETVTDSQRNEMMGYVLQFSNSGYSSFDEVSQFIQSHSVDSLGSLTYQSLDVINNVCCIYYNYSNNRYLSQGDFESAKTNAISIIETYVNEMTNNINSLKDSGAISSDEENELSSFINSISSWGSWIEDLELS